MILIIYMIFAAYVAGEKTGLILEEPFSMGATLNGKNDLDIEKEKKLVQEKLSELHSKNVSEKEERFAMKKFGLERFDPNQSFSIYNTNYMVNSTYNI